MYRDVIKNSTLVLDTNFTHWHSCNSLELTVVFTFSLMSHRVVFYALAIKECNEMWLRYQHSFSIQNCFSLCFNQFHSNWRLIFFSFSVTSSATLCASNKGVYRDVIRNSTSVFDTNFTHWHSCNSLELTVVLIFNLCVTSNGTLCC